MLKRLIELFSIILIIVAILFSILLFVRTFFPVYFDSMIENKNSVDGVGYPYPSQHISVKVQSNSVKQFHQDFKDYDITYYVTYKENDKFILKINVPDKDTEEVLRLFESKDYIIEVNLSSLH